MNIVFDLDGTLIDSAPDIQSVASIVLRRRGMEELTLQQTRSFVGEGSANFVRRMMAVRDIEETPESFSVIHEEFLALYEFAVDKAVFYPGVLATLTELRSGGHKLALCTNKPERPTRAVLRHMGMTHCFDAIMAGGMIESRKPEPDMLLQAVVALGGGPTLYVGDSEIDARTAQRAGIPFALYSGGYRKTPINAIHHHWVFDRFDALPGIVAEARGVGVSQGCANP